jgi:hypothetical protein
MICVKTIIAGIDCYLTCTVLRPFTLPCCSKQCY